MNHGRGRLAAVVNLVLGAGAGAAAARRPRRGLLWVAAVVLSVALVVVTPWILIVTVAIGLASTVDAYMCGARATQPLRVVHASVALVPIIGIASAFCLRMFVVEAFRIPSSSGYPALVIGDHIFVDKLSPHWRAIERGENIVFTFPCDAGRDYIKRVIAVGGDTVEIRCNVVWVNGVAVPTTQVEGACSYDDYDEQTDRWRPRACSRYHETVGGHDYDTFHDPERPARDLALATPEGRVGGVGDLRDFPTPDAPPPGCTDATADGKPIAGEVLGTIVDTKPAGAPTLTCEPRRHYVVPPDHLFVLGDNRSNSNDSRYWGSVPARDVKGRVIAIWLTANPAYHWYSRIGAVR